VCDLFLSSAQEKDLVAGIAAYPSSTGSSEKGNSSSELITTIRSLGLAADEIATCRSPVVDEMRRLSARSVSAYI